MRKLAIPSRNALIRDRSFYVKVWLVGEALAAFLDRIHIVEVGVGHQIETNRIALDMKKARGGISVPEFSKLLERMVINAEAVIDNADEAGLATVLLLQMIRQGREIGARIPADANAVAERLKERVGGALAELAEAVRRDVPTARDPLALIRQSSGQRYSAEVGTGLGPHIGDPRQPQLIYRYYEYLLQNVRGPVS